MPAREAASVHQKTEVEDQKDITDPEADPNMLNIQEATRKDEQKEAPAMKPGKKPCLFVCLFSNYIYNSCPSAV